MNKIENNINKDWVFPKTIFKCFLFFMFLLYVFFAYLSLSPTILGKNMDLFSSNRNTVKTTLVASRGVIYDKDKNVLAINVSSYNVIAYLSQSRTGTSQVLKHVVDKELTATKLAEVLGENKEYILNLLNQELYQVELGPKSRGITELKKDEIKALQLPGIDFVEYSKRYYPNGDFASYVVGYAKQYETSTKIDGVTKTDYSIVGELGIEGKYNKELGGTNGYLEYQRDRFGYKIPDTIETRTEPLDGNDIYLTIDANIQRFLEDEVKESNEIYKPEWLMLIAMDAKTGDILGSASTPSYDPNKLDIVNYENPLTSYVYEPGSVMKIYTYMCALEKGTYDGSATFESGSFKSGTNVINDWNKKGWGIINYDTGFEYSSNVGVANLLTKYINKADLKDCLAKYGFGEITDIELPRELNGNLTFNYPIEVIAAGFGQGISTTAIQQLQALTMIANDGVMLQPHIISKIVDSNTNKTTYEREVVSSDKVVSSMTVNKIKELMYNTVNNTNEGTTGHAYHLDEVTVIGKTGTAQVYNNANGGYSYETNDLVYSFAGIFPKDNPEIIIYGAMKKPISSKGVGLSRATKEAIKSISKYLNLYGNTTVDVVKDKYVIESYINKKVDDILPKLVGLDIVVLGDGDYITKQSLTVGTTVLTNDKIILITNDNTVQYPSFKGWSRQEIVTFFNMTGFKYELDGYGYVTDQSISAGTLIGEDIIKFTLNKKYDLDVVEE